MKYMYVEEHTLHSNTRQYNITIQYKTRLVYNYRQIPINRISIWGKI